MDTMRAMTMPRTGEPAVLQAREIPRPALDSATQILVRLHAAGVNPIDTKLRRNGTFYPDRLPTVLGCDGAGVVAEIGEDVQAFRPGDAVYFCHGGIGAGPGCYAEYTVVEEHCLAPKPASLDFVEAAAVPLVVITAWEALHDRTQLQSGQHLLVHAGAGGVGHVAIQLARIAGARIATTIHGQEKARFAESLGAELAIDYQQQDFVAAVHDWTTGDGVDIAMDNVGGDTFTATFPAVRVYGDLVTLLQPGSNTDWSIARERNLRISLEVMLTPMRFGLREAEAHQADILRQAARLIDAGQLQVHVSKTLPLAEAIAAHQLIEAGSTRGKIVLRID